MPDNDGKLTQQEKKAAVDWLNSHSFSLRGGCPVCGDNKWIIGDHFVTPTVFYQGTLMFGGGSYPQFMVISQTCGYTFYVNALMAKIVSVPVIPPPPAQTPATPAGPSLSDYKKTP